MKRKVKVGRQQTNEEAFEAVEDMAANIENTFRQLANAMSTLRTRIQNLKKSTPAKYSAPKVGRKRIENVAPGPPPKFRNLNNQSGFSNSIVTAFQRTIENASFVETVNQMASKMEEKADSESLYDSQVDSEIECQLWSQFLQSERIKLFKTYPTTELHEIDVVVRQRWDKMSEEERIGVVQANRELRKEQYLNSLRKNSRIDLQKGENQQQKTKIRGQITQKKHRLEKQRLQTNCELKMQYEATQEIDDPMISQTQLLVDDVDEGHSVVNVRTTNADILQDRIKQLFRRPN